MSEALAISSIPGMKITLLAKGADASLLVRSILILRRLLLDAAGARSPLFLLAPFGCLFKSPSSQPICLRVGEWGDECGVLAHSQELFALWVGASGSKRRKLEK
jgi:hypothetical protein